MAAKNEHKSAPWIITDFETGGVKLAKNPITEVAMSAIRGDNLELIERYETLIKPYGYDQGYEYEEIAFEKTGLNIAKLEKEGKPFDVVYEEVTAFLKRCNIFNNTTMYKPVLVAHNAPFEQQCWQHFFCYAKKEKEMEKLLQCSWDYHGHCVPAYLDTMQLSRMLFAANIRVKTCSLEITCEQLGIATADGHRAMNDVIPTEEVVKRCIKLLRSSDTGVASDVDQELSFRNTFQF